jgi:hypothetical protein
MTQQSLVSFLSLIILKKSLKTETGHLDPGSGMQFFRITDLFDYD